MCGKLLLVLVSVVIVVVAITLKIPLLDHAWESQMGTATLTANKPPIMTPAPDKDSTKYTTPGHPTLTGTPNMVTGDVRFKKSKTVVILVDIQYDFCPNGSLAVTIDESEFYRKARELKEKFNLVYASLDYHDPKHFSFYTTHTNLGISQTQGGTYYFDRIISGSPTHKPLTSTGEEIPIFPQHCVRGGAQTFETAKGKYASGFDLREELQISYADSNITFIYKGVYTMHDQFSAFVGYPKGVTTVDGKPLINLEADIKEVKGLSEVDDEVQIIVVGLAFEFCVMYTALNAVDAGFKNVYVVLDIVGYLSMFESRWRLSTFNALVYRKVKFIYSAQIVAY